jgi:RNA polymerase sigma-70 factor (sigma-E family)
MSSKGRRTHVRDEFERFVAGSVDDLLRTAYLVTWDLPGAQDLVQECLWQVARRWPRVRSMEHPTAYARKILLKVALDGARRRGRHRSELAGNSIVEMVDRRGSSVTGTIGMVETRSELVEGLKALAPRQRAVLVLRYLHDLPEAQVADILGCSVGTVKNTGFHALQRLRQALAPEGGPESVGAGPPEGTLTENLCKETENLYKERKLRYVRSTRS